MKLTLDVCVVHLDSRAIQRGEEVLRLTATEAALLGYLASRPQQLVSREELYREVWKHRRELQTRTLDLAILRLRRKIERDPRNPAHILTIYRKRLQLRSIRKAVEPPLNSAPQKLTTNIGREENDFFGRVDELARLTELVTSHRDCVTVLGPPGTGKTRLVKHWASKVLADEFVQSAWFCDLTEVRTTSGLLHTVASTLSIPLAHQQSDLSRLSSQIGAAIAGRNSTLVIFDNVEQAIDVFSPLLRDWWEVAPHARFIVTSQVPIGLSIEQRFPLLPFPTTSDTPAITSPE